MIATTRAFRNAMVQGTTRGGYLRKNFAHPKQEKEMTERSE